MSVPIGETRLSLLEAGRGRPLVLVHGAVTTSELFRGTVEHFARRYRAIAVDLRGYGDSDKPGSGYDIPRFAADLARLFDHLALEPAVLLGVSMGGFVAQRFALDHPGRLAGLVLASTSDGEFAPGVLAADPVAKIREVGWRQFSADLITGAFPPGTDPTIVAALLERISTWNEEVILGAARSMRAFDSRRELGTLRLPTLVLVGSEDHQLPVPLSQRLQRLIPGARLEVFDGAGHFMMVEQPERFHRVLDGFLTSVWP
jgi:pimeloyl-ACP methyl ester carboxylesterase